MSREPVRARRGMEWQCEQVRTHLLESADVTQRVVDKCLEAILATALLIADSLRAGGKLLLCGNGGSAADCQHMATELMSRLTRDLPRPGLAAIALTTDTSFLTAFANDSGFEGVFARQVQALGRAGDVLVGISTSGESANVLRAVEQAHRIGMRVVALTGEQGALASVADVAVRVPSADVQHIQEAHVAIEHVICYLVERTLYGDG